MNKYEERFNYWIKKDIGLSLQDVDSFDRFPFTIKYKMLKIFVEWACQPQNTTAIELGREKISHIDKRWLKEHLVDAAQDVLDLSDEWEYRRFVELVIIVVPELKEEAVRIGMLSDDEDIREAAVDYE